MIILMADSGNKTGRKWLSADFKAANAEANVCQRIRSLKLIYGEENVF